MPKQESAGVTQMPKKQDKQDFFQALYQFLLRIKLVYDADSFMCFISVHKMTINSVRILCEQQFEQPKLVKHRQRNIFMSDRGKSTKQNKIVSFGTLQTKTNSNTQAEV